MTLIALVLVTAAVLAWVNHRVFGLPTAIGVMVIALGMSLGLFAGEALGLDVRSTVTRVLTRLDFESALLDVMLAFLLFAGALHVQLDHLLAQRWVILLLATLGVLVTTALVAGMLLLAGDALGIRISLLEALLFGALISPTDPIAVLAILESAGAPKSLETKIVGESLFNDGVGIVLFTVLLALAVSTTGAGGAHAEPMGALDVAWLVVKEVGGALVLGIGAGILAFGMLRAVDNHQVEVLITLALATGVYTLARAVHASGPLAVVFAGLFIGNGGRTYAMSQAVADHVDTFWELVDEILNVVLFVLIGMEVLVIELDGASVLAGLVAIPLVLLARFLSVGGVVLGLRRRRGFTPHAVEIMTWGGLRGGISVALALAIPAAIPGRDLIVTMTYVIVVFSIVVQGLTIRRLVRWIPKAAAEER